MARLQSHAQVECPTCQRKFEERAAQRHIPICKQLTVNGSFYRKRDQSRLDQ
jgi:hypothetical protein